MWTDEEDEDEGDGGDLPGEGHLARVGILGDVEFFGGDLLEEEVDRNSVLVREVSPRRSLVPCWKVRKICCIPSVLLLNWV